MFPYLRGLFSISFEPQLNAINVFSCIRGLFYKFYSAIIYDFIVPALMGVFLHIHIIVVIRTFVPVLRGLFSGLNITNREDCCSRTHGSFSAYTYYYNNADFIIPVYRGLFYDYMFEPYSTLCPRIKWVIRAKMHSICKNFIILVYRGLFLKKAHYYMIVMVILVQTGVILSIYRVRP